MVGVTTTLKGLSIKKVENSCHKETAKEKVDPDWAVGRILGGES